MTDETDGSVDVRRLDDGTVVVGVGGHRISIREADGDPHLYLFDHATIRVEGELKDEVTVSVAADEFPTEIDVL